VYKAEVENQNRRKSKILRFAHRGEYNSNEMTEYCQKHRIIHEITFRYSLQSNGIARRKNRTLKDMVNAILLNSRALV